MWFFILISHLFAKFTRILAYKDSFSPCDCHCHFGVCSVCPPQFVASWGEYGGLRRGWAGQNDSWSFIGKRNIPDLSVLQEDQGITYPYLISRDCPWWWGDPILLLFMRSPPSDLPSSYSHGTGDVSICTMAMPILPWSATRHNKEEKIPCTEFFLFLSL